MSPPSKKACVVSHERSGTHFLMNTLALNFGYVSEPWWNLDYETGLNFYSHRNIERYLRQAHNQPVPNILKTHHHVDFFSETLDYLTDQFHVYYIYRDPQDVMCSFWRMLRGLSWSEGPKTETVGEFMRAAPSGGLMRYQQNQASNMLQRWRSHVEGWLAEAEGYYSGRIFIVRYEDLNKNFNQTVSVIGQSMGRDAQNIRRPAKDKNVVAAGKGTTESYQNIFTNEDHQFVHDEVGDLLVRLG
ncbi:MAG: hypothetical protein FD130_819 [Halothiobacillaceae bacterium]|nr:MAG: hypothetical protein FD130_819 [Halothiobacillaceae bacterium]